ncbi:uncharacterized protein BP01DRAFT_392714 [Aspergillus saccharolyticus JOP 1030-1]|uniref:Transmembrane protein n=1 Tax=Aspergillus saccharolyticus JOP 1030-1 TaxID=1450539 RepID=A0A318ZL29_9EURO|nr:hypothetical protein BP01DRAFT_392714 [Aspergillus saccharolyticus JOP 1030-1]PYH44490.1 hypothetical protein BP01DRAFT_392714 [Aspergillus saccharolyticus JOP 1030-1]
MPSLSTSIVSAVAILVTIGGAAASVVPHAQAQNLTVTRAAVHSGSESYRTQPIIAGGDVEGLMDVAADELDSTAEGDAAADTCYNRSHLTVTAPVCTHASMGHAWILVEGHALQTETDALTTISAALADAIALPLKVLAGLLAIVLIYSFCVLAYNRRLTQKYAAAEERARAEQATEMQRILTEPTEIPFGARALEKGIQVEGIWTPKEYSPRQSVIMPGDTPETPSPTQSQPSLVPASNVQRPRRSHQPVPGSNLLNPRLSMKIPDIELGAEAMRVFSANSAPQPTTRTNSDIPTEPGKKRRSRGWFHPRNSWARKPFDSYERMSKHEGKSREIDILVRANA